MRGICGRTRDATFDADGFYPTGDLGALDADGYLWYHGRLDDMFKVKGATVYPAEVEAALRADRRACARSHVTNVPDDDGADAVGALVVSARRSTSSSPAARARLSAFKVPTRWVVTDVGRRRADDQHREGRQGGAPGAAATDEHGRTTRGTVTMTRAIDCLVNVDLGDQEQPDWMVRVKDDYFKGDDSFFKSPELSELIDDMDAQRRRAGDPDDDVGRERRPRAALRRGATRPLRARQSAG